MRRLVVFALVTLLTLQAWAGAVMSVQMPMLSLADTQMVVAQAECAEHMALHGATDSADPSATQDAAAGAGTDADAGAAPTKGPHCNPHSSCQLCQLCSGQALAAVLTLHLMPRPVVLPQAGARTPFISAYLSASFKPPIS